eukprot:1143046-Pelagomonas_calceolata.AAC.4
MAVHDIDGWQHHLLFLNYTLVAIKHGHTLIATDNTPALHQIRNLLLKPMGISNQAPINKALINITNLPSRFCCTTTHSGSVGSVCAGPLALRAAKRRLP